VDHIYEFYRKLFGKEERGNIKMAARMWQDKGRLTDDQRESIIRPFSMEKVEFAIQEMKIETASGPDGFPYVFYKKFWGILK
jgi:hypothetical protein